jgi:F0F1-type ATP synthase delta subunit
MLRAFHWSHFAQKFRGTCYSSSFSSKSLVRHSIGACRQRRTFFQQAPPFYPIRQYATADGVPGLTTPADPKKLLEIQPDFVINKDTLPHVQLIFVLSGQLGKLQEVYDDFRALVGGEAYLREIFRMPFMDTEEKKKLIDQIAKIAPLRGCTVLFLKFLIDRNAEKLLGKIMNDFIRLVKFYKKEREVTITTNRPLSPQELEHYKETFKINYFTPDSIITIKNEVDPNISAGYKVDFDGKVAVDFTLDAQRDEAVRQLRHELDLATEKIKLGRKV